MEKKEKTKTSTAPEDSSGFNPLGRMRNKLYRQMQARSTPSTSAPKQDVNDGMVSSLSSDFAQMQVVHSGSGPSSCTLGDTTAITDPTTLEHKSSNKREQKIGQEKAFGTVCDFLTRSDVGKVGIYGMGGVGKTTLMKKVCYEFLIPSNFKVISIVVSRTVNVGTIQRSIMSELNLNFREEQDLYSRGMKINEALFNRKDRVALLLDDIWESLELEELGVTGAFELDTSKFKIIFTTRLEDVCLQMGPDQKMKVNCLGQEESWALFKLSVGDETLNSNCRILGLAKEVAKECGGLPLALTVIGKAMVCKTSLGAWEDALKSLKNCPSMISRVETNLFERLKFSYDNLENQVERECFLFCCMYPEDREIGKDTLVGSWIGNGLLDIGYGTYQEICNRGHDIIDTLVAKSLLEVRRSFVKMHDVIRDMGLYIGSKSNYFVHTNSLGLRGEEIDKRWNRARWIYVEDHNNDGNFFYKPPPSEPSVSPPMRGRDFFNSFTSFSILSYLKLIMTPYYWNVLIKSVLMIFGLIPQELGCPNLSTLHIYRPMGGAIEISNTFVNSMHFMPKVKVLIIHRVRFECPEIPRSTFGLLVELRHLEIRESNVSALPPDIGNLTKLLTLILYGSQHLTTLPTSIGGLCELRKLEINKFIGHSIKIIIPSELGNLKKLEMVDISTCAGLNIGNNFNHCAELRRLDVAVYGPATLSNDLLYNLKKLEELRMAFGRIREIETLWIKGLKILTSLKALRMSECPIAIGDELISAISAMRQLRELCITWCDIDKLVIPAAADFLPQLEVLEIRICHKLVKVHLSNRTLQSLRVLEIGGCGCLIQIFDDVQTSVCFPNLQSLRLGSLRRMKRICNDSVSFPSLSEFKLVDCPILEKLPRGLMNENRTTPMIRGKIVGSEKWWDRLEWEDDAFKSYLYDLFEIERDFLFNLPEDEEDEDEEDALSGSEDEEDALPGSEDEEEAPSV